MSFFSEFSKNVISMDP